MEKIILWCETTNNAHAYFGADTAVILFLAGHSQFYELMTNKKLDISNVNDFHGPPINQYEINLRAMVRKGIAISATLDHFQSAKCFQKLTHEDSCCNVVRQWLTPQRRFGMCIDGGQNGFDEFLEHVFLECKKTIKSAVNVDDNTKYVSEVHKFCLTPCRFFSNTEKDH